jgi:hypothetical protein
MAGLSAKTMLRKSFDLVSPLARDECIRRLRANTDSSWAIFSNKPLSGFVEDTSFRICKRGRAKSHRPPLSGELLDEGGGTRMRCRFGMHPVVVGLIVIYFGFLLIVGGKDAISAIGSLLAGHAAADAWISVAFPVFLLVFSAALVGLVPSAYRNDLRFLLDFLRDTIAAREA